MSDLSGVLKESVIFSSLDAEETADLVQLFQKRTLHTAEILATAGQPAQYCFLLEKGTLVLSMDKGRALVLDIPGDFAAMEVLSREGVYTSTITALEEGVVWAVPREAFLEFIQADTPAAAAVMGGWQAFLDARAPFSKMIAELDMPAMF